MKLFGIVFNFVIIAALAIGLITTCPTKKDFAEYYVREHENVLGDFLEEPLKNMLEKRTEADNYLIFSVFEVDEEDRYVGIADHFFGRSSAEQVAEVLGTLIDQAKEALDE